MSKKKWALIAFPSGYGKSLTYEIPEGISVSIGNWVLIPLGKREVWGTITALDFSEPTFACREVIEVYSKYSLSQKVFNRLNWVAEYYFGGMNRALDISFPKDWLKWKRVASTESKN
jgi:primosomal protein N'